MTLRSYLYVPGDRADRLMKVTERGADAVIADLEDAVAPSAKDDARKTVSDWVANFPAGRRRPEIWVRVNSGDRMKDDIAAVAGPALTGIYVPKVESADSLPAVGESLQIAALIESAAGVLAAPSIAKAPGVFHLALGEADLTAELGITLSEDGSEVASIRMQMVLASAAAGIAPPVGPVSTDFRDLGALRRSTEALRRLGFRGRAAIHPAQVPVINEAFTPTPTEVEWAKEVIALYEKAQSDGSGAIADANGRMIDEAVARAARQTIAVAEALAG